MNIKTINTMKRNRIFMAISKLLAVVLLSFSAYACSSPEKNSQESENPVSVTVETAKFQL
jgi:hypothetical protein